MTCTSKVQFSSAGARPRERHLDYVYTRAKVSGFVKVSGFLVFQVYGSARRLHYTVRHSDGQYNVNNFNTFEKHTPEQIDSDSLRKAVYTGVFSGFKCFRIQSFYFFSRIQGFRIRPTTEMIFHRIRRCMCKRMYESDAKTFRFCDESGIFRSSVNGVLRNTIFLNSGLNIRRRLTKIPNLIKLPNFFNLMVSTLSSLVFCYG